MASQAELEYLLGHALNEDVEYRERLMKDPTATAMDLGIKLTSGQDALLRTTDGKVFAAMAEMMPGLLPDPHPMWGD